MSGLLKSRYALCLTCLILDLTRKKKKQKGILAGRAKFPTHSYLVNNNNSHGRISFSVCAVLHQIHSGHGAVLIPILSLPDLHLYTSILIPLFLLDQTSHAPQFIHLKLEKERPLGGCPMHPWQQGKVLVGSSPTSDRLGPPGYQSVWSPSIHARLHDHLHVDQTDYMQEVNPHFYTMPCEVPFRSVYQSTTLNRVRVEKSGDQIGWNSRHAKQPATRLRWFGPELPF
ncbi:hypothetical protein BDV36DRAFT_76277 [Aspergillus pseudocaelatus]|uniref:Uncharacterized protein n=1 Tax=Aspergillus pseudocaelatus TaxID=1825620 RepID=A0ABQ6W8Q6_9EURO|nr:hypothetical protein BDV36DRAFT_76277 [Aspergillus pseudocaelatus]